MGPGSVITFTTVVPTPYSLHPASGLCRRYPGMDPFLKLHSISQFTMDISNNLTAKETDVGFHSNAVDVCTTIHTFTVGTTVRTGSLPTILPLERADSLPNSSSWMHPHFDSASHTGTHFLFVVRSSRTVPQFQLLPPFRPPPPWSSSPNEGSCSRWPKSQVPATSLFTLLSPFTVGSRPSRLWMCDKH